MPTAASAHPLGNFTTNRYAEVVASGDSLRARRLDLAEIPTFQAKTKRERLGRDAYAALLAADVRLGLDLRIDGSARQLSEIEHRLAFPRGVASLRTTRLEIVLDAGSIEPGAPVAVELRNDAFASRIGWKEIVVRGERGAPRSARRHP